MALSTCHLCACLYRSWETHRYGPARTCATNRLSQRAWARDRRLRDCGYEPAGAHGVTVRRAAGDLVVWSPRVIAAGRIGSWRAWAPGWVVAIAALRVVPAPERRGVIVRARADPDYRARVLAAIEAARTEAQIAFGSRDEEMLGRADVVQILRAA